MTDEHFHITAMFVTVDTRPIFFKFSVGMHMINLCIRNLDSNREIESN